MSLGALALAALAMVSCGQPTSPCGSFAFTGAPHSSRGIDMELSFDFDPLACKAGEATANTMAYVQIVRIIDFTTGNFLAPNSDQQNRIVTGRTQASLNGWAVDRLSGRVWGYYGRNNDGTFAGTLTPGSSTSAAVLRDTPSGWPDNSWFDAVSVPVCLAGDTACQDRLVAFYYWQFFVGTGGSVGTPLDMIAVDWHRDAVDESVAEWDADAAALGKNAFPTLTRMP